MSELESIAAEVTLIIDVREKDMMDCCTQKNIPFESASLEIGDILLKSNDTLVFERKTLADLDASIKDGRYHEQKQRLTGKFPFHRITYIVEGPLASISKFRNSKAMISALVSSRYRDGFHVIHTQNVDETIWYINEIRDRMTKGKTVFDTSNGEYSSSLKTKSKKIDNLTPELVYAMQLAQIPGISIKIAEDISKMYPSMRLLLQAIDEHQEKAFQGIKGIGKMRSQKINSYF